MMKKVFSMLLLVSMLCLALASCGDSDLDKSREYLENNQLVDKNPRETLTFCLVTDSLIDNAVLLAMQASFNKILESKRTHLQFVNWTTAEYETKLNEKLAAVKAARDEAASGGGSGSTSGSVAANDYPTVKDTQFDIILITSYEMLASLIESESVADLSELMDKRYYGLLKNEGVTASFLQGAKIDGKTYAVPNCRVVGEYTYMLISKRHAEYFGYYEKTDFSKWYTTDDLRINIRNTSNNDYRYEFTGNSYDENAPVRLVQGSYAYREELEKMTDYYWYVESTPVVKRSEIFNSMFAVSSYSVDVSRAMEVIYEINTTKSLRTILEYGVEKDTYQVEGGIVTVKSDAYKSNPLYTGNIFALYPTAETKDLVDSWKKHNQELVFADDIIPPPTPEGGEAE